MTLLAVALQLTPSLPSLSVSFPTPVPTDSSASPFLPTALIDSRVMMVFVSDCNGISLLHLPYTQQKRSIPSQKCWGGSSETCVHDSHHLPVSGHVSPNPVFRTLSFVFYIFILMKSEHEAQAPNKKTDSCFIILVTVFFYFCQFQQLPRFLWGSV